MMPDTRNAEKFFKIGCVLLLLTLASVLWFFRWHVVMVGDAQFVMHDRATGSSYYCISVRRCFEIDVNNDESE